MSISILTETPASNEPTKKMPLVTSKMGFLPKMSDTLPQIGVEALCAMRYAVPIQVYPEAELNSAVMVGRAVVTIVMSRALFQTLALWPWSLKLLLTRGGRRRPVRP